MVETRQPRQILIVGGGAGGLELAIRLARATRKRGSARIILADAQTSHIWKPRLHEIAVGLRVADDERARYAELAARYGFEFVLGAVERVDGISGIAAIAAVSAPDDAGVLIPPRAIAFDTAVLAIGSTVDDFGTPGVFEHCFALDNVEGADRLHRAILAQGARIKAGLQDRLRVVVVGAGTTGVEFAADLRSAAERMPQYRSLMNPAQVAITIVEMADRPLPGVATDTSDYARRLLADSKVEQHFGAKVTNVEAGRLRLADGSTVAGDILVWASGVRGRSIAVSPPPMIERGGRMRVDPMLRLVGEDERASDRVFALGDCAASFGPGDERSLRSAAAAVSLQVQRDAGLARRGPGGRRRAGSGNLDPGRRHRREACLPNLVPGARANAVRLVADDRHVVGVAPARSGDAVGEASLVIVAVLARVRPPQRVDQCTERRGNLAARIVEVAARIARAPVGQNLDQSSVRDLVRDVMLHHVAESGAGPDRGTGKHLFIDDERTCRANLHRAAVAFEFPRKQPAAADQAVIDADVTLDVGRRCRNGMDREIVRSTDHDRPEIRPDRHGDHIPVDRLAQANTGVEAARDQVDQPVVDTDLDRDLGMRKQEVRQSGRQDRTRCVGEGGESQGTRRDTAPVVERRQPARDLRQRRIQRLQQPLARGGRRNAARGAGKQAHAEPLLEAPHGVAQRGRREAELGRCAREAADARDSRERRQIVEVTTPHS